MALGIAIPILPARDLKQARAFYERLGFTAAGWWPDTDNYGQCYWRVVDPDGLYSELSRADLSAWRNARVVPIEDKPWGTREFALLDPNSNLIRIGRPKAL